MFLSRYLIITNLNCWKTFVSHFNQSSSRHTVEAILIEEIGSNFAQSGLTRLDASTASLTSEETLHVSWVVWCERLFIDWLEYGDGAIFILNNVGTTGSIRGESWFKLLRKAFSDLCHAAFNLEVSLHVLEELDGVRLCGNWILHIGR